MTKTDAIAALLRPMALGTAPSCQSWQAKAERSLCLGPPDAKHMSGGACTAMMVHALEDMTQKPLIQCATQFVRAPACDDDVHVATEFVSRGRSIATARAYMTAGGNIAATMTASLGKRDDIGCYSWPTPTQSDDPSKCPTIDFVRKDSEDLHSHLDMRIIGTPGEGAMDFWVRTPDEASLRNANFLALVADYLPEALHFNIKQRAGAISLDNILRVCNIAMSEWLLCRIQLHAVHDGLFHGQMHIYTQDNILLAVAGQSGVVTLLD